MVSVFVINQRATIINISAGRGSEKWPVRVWPASDKSTGRRRVGSHLRVQLDTWARIIWSVQRGMIDQATAAADDGVPREVSAFARKQIANKLSTDDDSADGGPRSGRQEAAPLNNESARNSWRRANRIALLGARIC